MTCIVGMEVPEGVILGADSATSSGDHVRITARKKLWKAGEFGFATCGSIRMSQILKYHLDLPGTPSPKASVALRDQWMVREFIPAVRTVMEENAFLHTEKGIEGISGGSFLVAWRGKLYSIYGDLQVAREINGVNALGSGYAYAHGALHALKDIPGLAPGYKVRKALDAAAASLGSVAPPYRVITVKTKAGQAT